MSNMSYCRFENTLSDLYDCYDNLTQPLSKSEHQCRVSLIELCAKIAEYIDTNLVEDWDQQEYVDYNS